MADQVIELTPPDFAEVVAEMGAMQARHAGWVNLQPSVPPQVLERPSTSTSLFRRRPRELTLATWTAGPLRRGVALPAAVGIQHGRPERVRALLGSTGLALPAGWRVVSDRPANGFVARLPEGSSHAAVLAWLIRAVEVVSPVPLEGTWRALVYRGRR